MAEEAATEVAEEAMVAAATEAEAVAEGAMAPREAEGTAARVEAMEAAVAGVCCLHGL